MVIVHEHVSVYVHVVENICAGVIDNCNLNFVIVFGKSITLM